MRTLDERFWGKVAVRGPNECWRWNGAVARGGYGKMWSQGKLRAAHRLAWVMAHGEIPDGMFLCHRCDTPACVNPAHLFIGSPSDNVRDMCAKGRHGSMVHEGLQRGTRNGRAKLQESEVAEIRRLHAANGGRTRRLAKQFCVSESLIRQIVRREVWSHVAA